MYVHMVHRSCPVACRATPVTRHPRRPHAESPLGAPARRDTMVLGFPHLRLSGAVRLLVCCLLVAPAILAARPAPWADALALGGGSYRVTASVFGVPDDDLVGEETSSGHVLAPYDRLVALPACTESSCPWVPVGTG